MNDIEEIESIEQIDELTDDPQEYLALLICHLSYKGDERGLALTRIVLLFLLAIQSFKQGPIDLAKRCLYSFEEAITAYPLPYR